MDVITSEIGERAAERASEGATRTVCVYCGSSSGTRPIFVETARHLGTSLAEAGFGLVYGGGDVGLMGAVARATLQAGGRVTGIIPDFLRRRENMIADAHELVVVPDMHTRKRMMFERADAFVAMPGGIGTLEELVEQLTWAQLGRHAKPIVLLDTEGFWQPLIALFAHMRESGFLRPGLEVGFIVARDVDEVLAALEDGTPRDGTRPEGSLVSDTVLASQF